MKKLTALLMSLFILFSTFPAQAGSVAGKWFLHLYGISESNAVCASVLAAKWDLLLREDGTGHVTVDMPIIGASSEDECAWTLAGDTLTILVHEAPQTFTLTGNRLYAVIDGTPLVWLRGELPPEYTDDVPKRHEQKVSAFNGTWNCVRITVQADGLRIPLEVMDIHADFILEDGNGWLVLTQENAQPLSLELRGDLSETADGTTLTVHPSDETAPTCIVLMLREDGIMVGTEMADGMETGCTYYLKPAEK